MGRSVGVALVWMLGLTALSSCVQATAQEEVVATLPVWQTLMTEGCESVATWKDDKKSCYRLQRMKVHGGWLVRSSGGFERFEQAGSIQNAAGALGGGQGEGLTFVPDPGHVWQVANVP